MYIELPFGIILASKNRITHTDPTLLQLNLYQRQYEERAGAMTELRGELAESRRAYIAASAAKGTLHAENQELKRVIERLETGIREREAKIGVYRSEISRLRDTLALPAPGIESAPGPETPVGKLDNLIREREAKIGVVERNSGATAAQHDPRTSVLASNIVSPWDYIPGLNLEDSEEEIRPGIMDIS